MPDAYFLYLKSITDIAYRKINQDLCDMSRLWMSHRFFVFLLFLQKSKKERITDTMNKTFETLGYACPLGYDEILNRLKERANSTPAKNMIGKLRPYMSESELRRNMNDTTQARQLLDLVGMPPIPAMEHVELFLDKAVMGELLLPGELEQTGTFLAAVKRMQGYLEKGKAFQIPAAYYNENLVLMEELREEIERSIRCGQIDDHASGLLRDIRRDLLLLEEKIKNKTDSIMKSQKKYMAEAFVVKRNGRVCLPVKKEFRTKIAGSVIDKSATGATLFVEPEAVRKLQEEYEVLKLEEDNEERRIIYTFMNLIAEQEEAFRKNIDTLVKLDFIFAKGKLSADMQAIQPDINTNGYLCLQQARHPMLSEETCVPLDFEIGGRERGVVITGPNTGGKTVAIKTVGLFSLMSGSGLHLPCTYANICMNNQVLCDIGDGQNIADNLSTFSAHIRNILEILQKVTQESLVILDELGSGTDPAEGMGIAISILEQLRLSGCLFLATTHYPEVKAYAKRHEEIVNARMAFDKENLKPLFRLEIGRSGDSCALYIAKRLGMPDMMLLSAAKEAYGEVNKDLIRELDLDKLSKNKLKKIYVPRILKITEKQPLKRQISTFARGDSVMVFPDRLIGIVVNPADKKGNVLVQIKKEKVFINHKRLKLKAAASELYPEDYDFSIIFDSVENRKARHKMGKGYQQDLEIQGYGSL